MKTGFDALICTECAYNHRNRCAKCNSAIKYIHTCPKGYTYELMREIAEDISKRRRRLPHGTVFSREW